jgi:hypothetical protein
MADMNDLSDAEIRTRAFQLWLAAGGPGGRMDAFWYQAEKELLAERADQGELPPGMTDNLLV